MVVCSDAHKKDARLIWVKEFCLNKLNETVVLSTYNIHFVLGNTKINYLKSTLC